MADLQIFAKSQKNHNLVFYGDQILATGFKMHILPLHHRITRPFDVYITLNKSFTITVQIWLSHRVLSNNFLFLDSNSRRLEYCFISGNAKDKSLGSSLFCSFNDIWKLRSIQFACCHFG